MPVVVLVLAAAALAANLAPHELQLAYQLARLGCAAGVDFHRVDQCADISSFCFGARHALAFVPGVPFLDLGLGFAGAEVLGGVAGQCGGVCGGGWVGGGWREGWAGEDGRHVAFHRLLVKAIEAEAGRGGWAGGAGAWEAADGLEGVDEDTVYRDYVSDVGGMVLGEG